jgi:hypothetical protein
MSATVGSQLRRRSDQSDPTGRLGGVQPSAWSRQVRYRPPIWTPVSGRRGSRTPSTRPRCRCGRCTTRQQVDPALRILLADREEVSCARRTIYTGEHDKQARCWAGTMHRASGPRSSAGRSGDNLPREGYSKALVKFGLDRFDEIISANAGPSFPCCTPVAGPVDTRRVEPGQANQCPTDRMGVRDRLV